MKRWLVWSNEHRAWWGPDKCGYTTIEHAGRYSLREASDICRHANYRGPDMAKHILEAKRGNPMPSEIVVPSPELVAETLAEETA